MSSLGKLMYHDLCVPWNEPGISTEQVLRVLNALIRYKYGVVALNETKPYIRSNTPQKSSDAGAFTSLCAKHNVKCMRRLTVVLTSTPQTTELAQMAREYDLLAVRPTNERTFLQACSAIDCDLISLDLTSKLEFSLRPNLVKLAISRGIHFEVCYAPLIRDPAARRYVISNLQSLLVATKYNGKGLVISSDAHTDLECRPPFDTMNLLTLTGLAQNKARYALVQAPTLTLERAFARSKTYKSVVRRLDPEEVPESVKRAKLSQS